MDTVVELLKCNDLNGLVDGYVQSTNMNSKDWMDGKLKACWDIF